MADNTNEQRMRELLTQHAAQSPAGAELDAESIITRARRRRVPRQLAVGGASALAVVGLLIVGLPVITGPGGPADMPMSASTLSEMDGSQRGNEEAPQEAGTADMVCVSPVAPSTVHGVDVSLNARSVTGPAGEWRIDAEIVLTNTSASTRDVDLEAAIFTLDQNGSTLGSHYGGVDGPPATLAPGETSTYTVSFEPMPCGLAGVLVGEFTLWATIALDHEQAARSVTINSP